MLKCVLVHVCIRGWVCWVCLVHWVCAYVRVCVCVGGCVASIRCVRCVGYVVGIGMWDVLESVRTLCASPRTYTIVSLTSHHSTGIPTTSSP